MTLQNPGDVTLIFPRSHLLLGVFHVKSRLSFPYYCPFVSIQPPHNFPVSECAACWQLISEGKQPVLVWVQAVPRDCPLLVRPGHRGQRLDRGMDQRGFRHLPRGHYLGPSTASMALVLFYGSYFYLSISERPRDSTVEIAILNAVLRRVRNNIIFFHVAP